MDSLAGRVHELLLKRGETIAVAESCTGGRICSELSSMPGASKSFCGGIIAYQRRVKESVLAVSPDIIKNFGIVSVETALGMAMGAARVMGAHWGLATTGICGPGKGGADAPLGCVCMAVAYQEKSFANSQIIKVWSERHEFDYISRLQVQLEATQYILSAIEGFLRKGF
ncbi:MAG: CinA family protein [Bradymonadales bacterium]|jgi:nicotinamide-nucleotide amidase